MSKYYRTLFVGKLVQDSSLSIGGTETLDPVCDDVLCRDGQDRITLRGTALAGALVATARKIDRIPEYVSGGFQMKKEASTKSQQTGCMESLWRIFNSHPQNAFLSEEYRQGVGIHYETGAARDGTLFDVESVPRDTRWWFCLEVKQTDTADGQHAERLAAAALYEWTKGHCWIGANVARGMGWMTLKDLCAYRLEVDKHLHVWPNSQQDPYRLISGGHASIRQYFQNIEPVELVHYENFEDVFRISQLRRGNEDCWHYLEIEGTITAGKNSNGYGLDAMSICGHSNDKERMVFDSKHYLGPVSRKQKAICEEFDPDNPIMITQQAEGEYAPFISGASIRGALRHAVHRLLRAHKHDVPRPGRSEKIDPKAATDPLVRQYLQMTGSLVESAQWLVRDAYLVSEDQWTAALLQQHAEDEFAGGVYAQSKFNRIALLQAKFKWKMVIEFNKKPHPEEYQDFIDILKKHLIPRAEHRHLPIGGGKWHGAGWPEWEVLSTRLKSVLCENGDVNHEC